MVLKKCSNKVAGIGGAADVLQIPASTLNSKMRRLNIKRAYKGKSI
jgi:formate hydrogenlyase transcriptional activator